MLHCHWFICHSCTCTVLCIAIQGSCNHIWCHILLHSCMHICLVGCKLQMLSAVSSKKGVKPCCPCPESSPIPLEMVFAAGAGQHWSKCLPGRQHGLNTVIMLSVWEEGLPSSSCLCGKTALCGPHQQSSGRWFCHTGQLWSVPAIWSGGCSTPRQRKDSLQWT